MSAAVRCCAATCTAGSRSVDKNHSEVLVRLLRDRFDNDRIRMAEVGVLAGENANTLLQGLPHLDLLLVDQWGTVPPSRAYRETRDPEAFRSPVHWQACYSASCSVAALYRARSRVWCGDSADVAARLADASLDAVFLDADHSYEGIVRDLAAWVPKVRPGGLVMGHDYATHDQTLTFGCRFEVMRAVDEWAAAAGLGVRLAPHMVWHVGLPGS